MVLKMLENLINKHRKALLRDKSSLKIKGSLLFEKECKHIKNIITFGCFLNYLLSIKKRDIKLFRSFFKTTESCLMGNI